MYLLVLYSSSCQMWFISGVKSTRQAWRYVSLQNNLGFSLCTTLSVCCIVITLDKRKKSEMKVSTDWCIAIEYQKSSLIRVIFINYQTSELQCNYQSYIQRNTIGDAWGFRGIALIATSGGFSIETLIEVTPSQKTKSNRSISTMKNRIPKWLQHYHKACCKKDSCCRR